MSCGEKRRERREGDNSQKTGQCDQVHKTKRQDGAWTQLQVEFLGHQL